MATAGPGRGATTFGLRGDRSVSLRHWDAEQEVLGPGLQAVMVWSRLCVTSGSGALLQDVDGNTVVDFQGAGGVNSIGHAHPRWVAEMKAHLERAVVGAFGSDARLEFTRSIRRFLPPQLDRVQLYSGGTEAVEAALRLAKSVTGKYEFLSFWGAFHGKSLGSLALTSGARRRLGPLPPGFFAAPYANCYRCPLRLSYPSCGLACVDFARDVIREESTGALAAIVVEPVQGRAGNVVPPPGYLSALASLAREFDALLIVDEMMTGFGRTGTTFGYMEDDAVPDVLIVGKGMGAGYPVTGIVAGAEAMDAEPFSEPSASSSSFGGFPLACAAAAAALDVIADEDLTARAQALGTSLLDDLGPLADEAPVVGEVRGRGLAIGIELVEDKDTRAPLPRDRVREVFLALLDAGVLVMVGGNSLRLYPPLNVDEDVAHEAVDIIVRELRTFDGSGG